IPSREEFRTLADRGNLIPLVVDLVADAETPVSAFAKMHKAGPCFLFESAEKHEESGRFSFIGSNPLLVFASTGATISITENGRGQSFEASEDPLAELEKVMKLCRFVAPES